MGQTRRGPMGLAPPEAREGSLGLALEAAFPDERRLAVADEDDRRLEIGRDDETSPGI